MQKSKPISSDFDLNPVENSFINFRSGNKVLKLKIITLATNEQVSTTYISDDIAFSILSKLPLKSFKRFECVCKSWSLLSKNTHFMNMFRNNLLSNSYYDGASLLFNVYDKTIRDYIFYSLSGEKFQNKVKLDISKSFKCPSIFGFGSINGTLCLHVDNYGKIVLWNPITQTTKLLPPSPSISDVAKDFECVTVWFYLHGFGYDNLINDYKVIRYVCIMGIRSNEGYISAEPFWEIYSLRSNSWRKLDVNMPSSKSEEGTQVYMNGLCHWLCQWNSSVGKYCVVSFYLSNEMFFITPIPSDEDVCFEFGAWINLVVLNRSIAFISYHKKTTTFYISILGELGVEESWTKLFIVGPLSCVERPLGVGTKGEIFFVRKDKELVWLDLSTQMIEEVGYKVVNYNNRITIYKEKFFLLEE
jgi:molecular chaperone HtpG